MLGVHRMIGPLRTWCRYDIGGLGDEDWAESEDYGGSHIFPHVAVLNACDVKERE